MGQETRSWGELAIVHKSLCVSRFDSARMEKPSVGRPACWLDFEQSLQLGFEAADDRDDQGDADQDRQEGGGDGLVGSVVGACHRNRRVPRSPWNGGSA